MAVQIVDPTPDPSVVKYCTCRSCGVRLSYTKPDIKEDYTTDYLGGKDYYFYIVCPSCVDKVHVGSWR